MSARQVDYDACDPANTDQLEAKGVYYFSGNNLVLKNLPRGVYITCKGNVLIEGNVSAEANIHSLDGSIQIKGHVGSNVTLEATKEINVDGNVDWYCNMSSLEGDISVSKGVGKHSKLLTDGGNITVFHRPDYDSVDEDCILEAPKGSIYLDGPFAGKRMRAGQNIETGRVENPSKLLSLHGNIKVNGGLSKASHVMAKEGAIEITHSVGENCFLSTPQQTITILGNTGKNCVLKAAQCISANRLGDESVAECLNTIDIPNKGAGCTIKPHQGKIDFTKKGFWSKPFSNAELADGTAYRGMF
jgi:hypothetical protein